MILSVFKKIISASKYFEKNRRLMMAVQYAIIALCFSAIIFGHNQAFIEIESINLRHAIVFLGLLLLSALNLFLETGIWKSLLNRNDNASFHPVLKAVCISYTIKSVSTHFIGAILGKQQLFGLRRFKKNILSHVQFGLYQTLATIVISTSVIVGFQSIDVIELIPGFNLILPYSDILLILVIVIISFFLLTQWNKIQWKLTVLVFSRTSIYFIQFTVLFALLNGDILLTEYISLIAVYFIVKTFLPVFNIFGGIGLRELALITIFSLFGLQSNSLLLIGLMIWIANFVFPAILGSYYLTKSHAWSPLTLSSR